ncbi:MAG: ABC transporter permease subunit, partial [Selenomonas sp.]|nr:ABC transporter permease subunit [Selenomonas sp.]
MTIGIVVFISLAGTTVGIMAALAGGAVEQSFMRFLDVVLAIPSMVLVLVMVSIFGNGIVTTTIA